jgi:hypothetical protein
MSSSSTHTSNEREELDWLLTMHPSDSSSKAIVPWALAIFNALHAIITLIWCHLLSDHQHIDCIKCSIQETNTNIEDMQTMMAAQIATI